MRRLWPVDPHREDGRGPLAPGERMVSRARAGGLGMRGSPSIRRDRDRDRAALDSGRGSEVVDGARGVSDSRTTSDLGVATRPRTEAGAAAAAPTATATATAAATAPAAATAAAAAAESGSAVRDRGPWSVIRSPVTRDPSSVHGLPFSRPRSSDHDLPVSRPREPCSCSCTRPTGSTGMGSTRRASWAPFPGRGLVASRSKTPPALRDRGRQGARIGASAASDTRGSLCPT